MKTAIIHVPHNPCEDSLKHMLESVGYRVFRLPKKALKTMMTHCRQNVKKRLPEATWKQFMNADLLVVIKHFSVAKVRKSWPHLKDRVLWFDINGGQPSANPPTYKHFKLASPAPYVGSCKDMNDPAVSGPRYVCYIPLADRPMFEVPRTEKQHPPICLVTNVHNWGYGGLAALVAKSGVVRMYGGHTKRGMIPYAKVPQYLSSATCYVHIKSRDCPGFSLYQAMAVNVPWCSRPTSWRGRSTPICMRTRRRACFCMTATTRT